MIKKKKKKKKKKKNDLKRQQQKERQAGSQSSPPRKKNSSQGTQKTITSNRERKGAKNAIQQHNRFGSLSYSSDDMEFGEAQDRP